MAKAIMYLFNSPSRVKKDGTFPIVLKVTHKRKRRYYPTEYSCMPEQWDMHAAKFNRSFPDYKAANDALTLLKGKAVGILSKGKANEIPFDFDDFTRQYTGTVDSRNLKDYFAKHIAKLEAEGKAGTAAPYKQALSAIISFRPSAKDMLLHGVTYSFLIEFEHWLKVDRNLKDTSISVYMRALRTILNRAIKERILRREQYPFDQYLISDLKTETQKRAIPKAVVKQIEALPLDLPRLQLARDIFIFSYYCRGINFADLAYLTAQNIDGDNLKYIRKKTGGAFVIRLRPETRRIIDFYTSQNDPQAGGYIFPVFDDRIHRTEKQKFDRRKTALKATNAALKEIAAMIGMEGLPLSTYTARHSYAQALREAGTSTGKISQAMGHSSEKVTEIYLKQFGDDTLNEIDKDAL